MGLKKAISKALWKTNVCGNYGNLGWEKNF